MKNIQQLQLKKGSQEEVLPGFDSGFPYIATCAELDKFYESSVPWHWHKTVELFYIKSGCLEYTTPKGRWIFPAGSGGFVNTNVLHTSKIRASKEQNIQFLHLFELSLISGEHGSRMEKKYIMPLAVDSGIEMIALYPTNPIDAEILYKIRQAFELSDQEWGYEFKIREMLTQIWLSLFEVARPRMEMNKSNTKNDQIKQMMIYIHDHYQQQIHIEEMAEAVHISKRGCFRLFQENLHMTPTEYIKSYRLRMSCQMLAEGKKSITEIANLCGFGSSSYFGKLFRMEYGCTPLEYRNNWHDYDNYRHK